MDKNRQVIWEMSYDMPTVLTLMAAICLWGFVASAAMIYSSALTHEIENKSVLLALQAKS